MNDIELQQRNTQPIGLFRDRDFDRVLTEITQEMTKSAVQVSRNGDMYLTVEQLDFRLRVFDILNKFIKEYPFPHDTRYEKLLNTEITIRIGDHV
jgi:hypothetical protein